MADRFNAPLSGLRPGGYVNDLVLQAYGRPALSMPLNDTQSMERTLLGNEYVSPIHGEKLPPGMTYDSPEYMHWRSAIAASRAAQDGARVGVAPPLLVNGLPAGSPEEVAQRAANNNGTSVLWLDLMDSQAKANGGRGGLSEFYRNEAAKIAAEANERMIMEAAAELDRKRAAEANRRAGR
jgi:hypothetical protein